MSNIELKNITFSYYNHHDLIFDDVTLNINTNWKIGLIGGNGKGKTTLLKILMNQLDYTGLINCKTTFEYFPFDVDGEQLTIKVINNIVKNYQTWELERELSLLHVNTNILTRKFNTLSKGEQTKVLLTALFLKENTFLLIDEPTNHLDIEGRNILANYLKKKTGFILVSHDRNLLDSVINHVLSINKKSIDLIKGNYTTWYDMKTKREKYEANLNEKLNKDIKHLEKVAQRSKDWSNQIEKSKFAKNNGGIKPLDRGFIGHKSAKMMKKSKNAIRKQEQSIELKKELLQDVEVIPKLKIDWMSFYNKTLIRTNKISLYYNKQLVINKFSIEINNGDCIALLGRNGAGKSSILKLLNGEDIAFEGDFYKAESIKISYVEQDVSKFYGTLDEYTIKYGIDKSQFYTILRKFGFKRQDFEKNIKTYSQGQKKKVVLARSLCTKAHLYIWDEPLNYLDIVARMQIENLIIEYKPTIIFVEHDERFVCNVASKVINL